MLPENSSGRLDDKPEEVVTEISESRQCVCRECRERVQPGAIRCRHCRCVAPLVSHEEMQALNEEMNRRRLVGCFWVLMVLAILAVFIWDLMKR